MAGAATEKLVKQIIQDKVQAGAMFTAYDITQEVRRRGVSGRHADIRDLVHQCHQRGDMGAAYNRTSINLTKGPSAFLYHRFDADPYIYPGAVRPTSTPPTAKGGKSKGGSSAGPRNLGLDAGDFLPISREELKGA